MLILSGIPLPQDYHNLRVVAYNSRVQELETQTGHLSESRSELLFLYSAGARQRTRGV